jgi:hypothetical protein
MAEDEKDVDVEPKGPIENQTPRKFLIIMPSDEGIAIRIEGMDIDEARKVMSMGHIKFEIEYDAHLRRLVK